MRFLLSLSLLFTLVLTGCNQEPTAQPAFPPPDERDRGHGAPDPRQGTGPVKTPDQETRGKSGLREPTTFPWGAMQEWPCEYAGHTRKGDALILDPSAGDFAFHYIDEGVPFPDELRVVLKKSIQIGQLEVTPLQVERRRLVFRYEDDSLRNDRAPTLSQGTAFVMTLQLTNLSEDVAFLPTDPAFEKRWSADKDSRGDRPYSYLELGGQRFYGGPCRWSLRPAPQTSMEGRMRPPLESIEGQQHGRYLKPGESFKTIVCTDPENQELQRAWDYYQGKLLWAVQLRRGLRASAEARPVSALVGVEFQVSDVVMGKLSMPEPTPR